MKRSHAICVLTFGAMAVVAGACKQSGTGNLAGTQVRLPPPEAVDPCASAVNQRVQINGVAGFMASSQKGKLQLALTGGQNPGVVMSATEFGSAITQYSGSVVRDGKVVAAPLAVQVQGTEVVVVVVPEGGSPIPIGKVTARPEAQGATVPVSFDGYGTCVVQYFSEGAKRAPMSDGSGFIVVRGQQDPGQQGPGQQNPGQQGPGQQGPGQNPGQQDPAQQNPGQQDPGQTTIPIQGHIPSQSGSGACALPENLQLPLEGYPGTTMKAELHSEGTLTAVFISQSSNLINSGTPAYHFSDTTGAPQWQGGMYRNGKRIFGSLRIRAEDGKAFAYVMPDQLRSDITVPSPVKVGEVQGWTQGMAYGGILTIKPANGACLVRYQLSGSYTGFLSGGQAYLLVP